MIVPTNDEWSHCINCDGAFKIKEATEWTDTKPESHTTTHLKEHFIFLLLFLLSNVSHFWAHGNCDCPPWQWKQSENVVWCSHWMHQWWRHGACVDCNMNLKHTDTKKAEKITFRAYCSPEERNTSILMCHFGIGPWAFGLIYFLLTADLCVKQIHTWVCRILWSSRSALLLH